MWVRKRYLGEADLKEWEEEVLRKKGFRLLDLRLGEDNEFRDRSDSLI